MNAPPFYYGDGNEWRTVKESKNYCYVHRRFKLSPFLPNDNFDSIIYEPIFPNMLLFYHPEFRPPEKDEVEEEEKDEWGYSKLYIIDYSPKIRPSESILQVEGKFSDLDDFSSIIHVFSFPGKFQQEGDELVSSDSNCIVSQDYHNNKLVIIQNKLFHFNIKKPNKPKELTKFRLSTRFHDEEILMAREFQRERSVVFTAQRDGFYRSGLIVCKVDFPAFIGVKEPKSSFEKSELIFVKSMKDLEQMVLLENHNFVVLFLQTPDGFHKSIRLVDLEKNEMNKFKCVGDEFLSRLKFVHKDSYKGKYLMTTTKLKFSKLEMLEFNKKQQKLYPYRTFEPDLSIYSRTYNNAFQVAPHCWGEMNVLVSSKTIFVLEGKSKHRASLTIEIISARRKKTVNHFKIYKRNIENSMKHRIEGMFWGYNKASLVLFGHDCYLDVIKILNKKKLTLSEKMYLEDDVNERLRFIRDEILQKKIVLRNTSLEIEFSLINL